MCEYVSIQGLLPQKGKSSIRKQNTMKRIILIILLSVPSLGFTFWDAIPALSLENKIDPSEMKSFLTTSIVDGQIFLNIPEKLLETPLLFVRFDGIQERNYLQVVWSLHQDKILLKVPSIKSSAGNVFPAAPALKLEENLIAIFPLEERKSGTNDHTINITELLLGQAIEWTPGFTETLIPQISLLMDSKDMDGEVIIKTRRGLIKNESKVALPVFYSFSTLPEPMKPRRYDYRMGFPDEVFTAENYGTKNRTANITKWRLEKRHKHQKISVPTEPITFLLSPEIPEKWRRYVKAGIEEWQPAFEAAGFKDALVVKEMDSLSEWQLHSVKNSIVFWDQNRYLRGNENVEQGGTIARIVDLRSGEILRCDILLGASAQFLSEKYFIRAAPLDKRAQKFPFPDELTGTLFQYVAAHEAGHAFGIMDANYGEYAYPFEKMNDSLWLSTMGYTPSIMNYTRFNNIPQPEDNVPPSLLIQKAGPIDHYNIKWAYTQFPEGTNEQTALEHIVRVQDSVPWFRYNNSQFEVIGPAASEEVVETNDPVRSTEMALKNLERVVALLPQVNQDQEDNARLERLYSKVLELWYNHMLHVASLIGGYDIHYKSINQPGKLYNEIPLRAQQEALGFLLTQVVNPPVWLTDPEFHNRIRYSTFPDEILGYQQYLIYDLITPNLLKRLEQLEQGFENQEVLQNYISRVQAGLFKELKNTRGKVNRRNQELQMTYIDRLITVMGQERINIYPTSKTMDYTDYSLGLLMQQLISLKKEIEHKVNGNHKLADLGHWQRCLVKINEVLKI